MKQVDLEREYYVKYGYYEYAENDTANTEDEGTGHAEAMPLYCYPVYGWDGMKHDPPVADPYVRAFRVEVMKMRDLPVSLLQLVFEDGAFDLLERLSIGEVLAVKNMHCEDDYQEGDG